MARWCFLAYSTLILCLVCLVGGQSIKYELQGQEVSLKPKIPGKPDEILWKHNGNKVVEFNSQEQHVYKQFENRITLDWETAELNISNLRFEDSGEYELEVDVNKGLHRSFHKLQVIDKVAKPTITCDMNDGSSSNISAKLVCSAEPRRPQSLMKFEWKSKGNVQPGPKLTIPLGGKHDDEVHSCSVSNPASRESATFTAKDCYTDTSSPGLIAGLFILFVVLLLLVVLITLYLKLRQKACFKKGDLEKQPQPETAEGVARPLLHRESTFASKQPLRNLNDNAVDMGIKEGHVERAKKQLLTGLRNDTDEHTNAAPTSRTPLDTNNLSHYQSDADEEEPREPAEEVPEHDPSDSERPNEADPLAAVSDDAREDTQSDLEVPTSPLQTGNDTDEHTKAAPPSPPCTESPSQLDMNNLSHNDKSDADEEELREPAEEVPEHDPSDSERPNEADPPAAVSDDIMENTQSDLEVPTSPLQTGYVQKTKYVFEPNNGGMTLAKKLLTGNDTDEHTKAAPPSPPCTESPSQLDMNNLSHYDKSDADEEELREPAEEVPEHDPSERPNEADPPAAVSDDIMEDTQADLEVPTSPLQTGLGNDTDEHTKAAPVSPPCHELREPAEEKIPQCDPSDSEKPNEADPPAAVSDDAKGDTQSDLEVPTSPLPTGYVKRTASFIERNYGGQTPPQKLATEPENVAERNVEDKETDEDDEKKKADDEEKVKSAPPNAETSPAALPHFTADENKEDANSDQVTEETVEKTVRESDSSGKEERKESDEFPEDKQLSTAPEEKSSETTRHEQNSNLSQEATETREDNQPDTVEPVSENENETDMAKDLAEPDLYLDESQQPPSPAPTKPENRNTETLAARPNTAHADQEKELKTRHDSAGQS